jgi:hypothetical protein
VRFGVLGVLSHFLLLADSDEIAQHLQKLRLELVLVGLATGRGDCREGVCAERQHVGRGVLQDRFDRLSDAALAKVTKAEREAFEARLAMVFLKPGIRRPFGVACRPPGRQEQPRSQLRRGHGR